MAVVGVLLLLPMAMLAMLSQSCMAYDQVRNVLYSGEILKFGECLGWGDPMSRICLFQDGNLCSLGVKKWCAGITGPNTYLRLQRDGNMAVFNGGKQRLWISDTRSVRGDYALVYQNDRNTVLYGDSKWSVIIKSNSTDPPSPSPESYYGRINSVVGDPSAPKNILYTNQTLKTGEQLSWGDYRLTMKTNCNLGLYHSETQVWSTKTNGKGRNCYAAFGTDGNLVVHSGSNTRLWSTDIQWGEGSYVLILRKDGNVVLYGEELWSANTSVA